MSWSSSGFMTHVSHEDRAPQFDRLLVAGRYGLGDLEAVVRERSVHGITRV
jgi:hypothetical protein